MPVIIPENLPATRALQREYIPVMHERRALTQDIRPLKIALVNLMPKKIETEIQFLRLIGNTPLQVEVDLIAPATHESKNTSRQHLLDFYKTIDQIEGKRYDGCIVTGAPVEHMAFEEVDYWEELKRIMDFCLTDVFSTIFICWGAQAALYYYYNIPKVDLSEKLFGVFLHKLVRKRDITRGFNDVFYVPHSRHTMNRKEDLLKNADLKILVESEQAGVLFTTTVDQRHYFISGHLEYDRETLRDEYDRDRKKGMDNVPFPHAYFPDDDPDQTPLLSWQAHANLLYSNWLNHIVYQRTPYDLGQLAPRQLILTNKAR